MRAVICEHLGDPLDPPPNAPGAALRVRDDWPAPLPQGALPPAGHVRVKIAAASLNFADLLQVAGQYQDRPRLPFVVGSDFSGVVIAAGPGVPPEIAAPGTRVCGVAGNAAFAAEAVVPAAGVWRVPDALTDLQAAAGIPVAFGTAELALRHRAELHAGQTLLVLGASGGVGAAAVQLGVLSGAAVVAVARGEDKCKFCREQLGAHAVVDTAALQVQEEKGGDSNGKALVAAIKAALAQAVAAKAGAGGQQQSKHPNHPPTADVVFDNVGGDQFAAALRCCSWGAQLLAVGFASGAIPRVPSNVLLVKNATLHGIFWGAHLSNPAAGHEGARVLREGVGRVLGLAAEGKLRVHTSARLPLARVGEALALMAGRRVQGKVLLVVDEDEGAAGGNGGKALIGGPPAYPRSRL